MKLGFVFFFNVHFKLYEHIIYDDEWAYHVCSAQNLHFASVALHLARGEGKNAFLCLSCVLFRSMSHTMLQGD